jgi:hypothetical protein
VTTNLRKEEIVQEAFIKTGRVWNCILTNEVYKLKHIKHIGNHLSLTKRGFIKYGYNPVVFDNPLSTLLFNFQTTGDYSIPDYASEQGRPLVIV